MDVTDIIGAALTGIFGWGMRFFVGWVQANTEAEKARCALTLLHNAAETAVRETELRDVPRLKAKNAGMLTKQTADQAKSAATLRARRMLGATGVIRLAKALNVHDNAAHDLLDSTIESHVSRLKK